MRRITCVYVQDLRAARASTTSLQFDFTGRVIACLSDKSVVVRVATEHCFTLTLHTCSGLGSGAGEDTAITLFEYISEGMPAIVHLGRILTRTLSL